jgi:prolyl-tRNA synthetase
MRIEIGPKDIENGECVMVRRDTRDKRAVAIESVADEAQKLLDVIQRDMFVRARNFRDSHTYEAGDYETFKKTVEEKPGFIKAYWCGDQACEDQIKEDTKATSRCIPLNGGNDVPADAECVCCGKKAKKLVYWGRAY